MFLVSAPPSLSDPVHNPITTATPWEHDRLLGLSLEDRVRREYERNLKQPSDSGSALVSDNATSLSRPSFPAPVPSSPSATSVTASNFLTPQNLTPSPSGAVLPLSTTSSPKATEPRQIPSAPPTPPKSPEPADTHTKRANETPLDPDTAPFVRNVPTESQSPRPLELDRLGVSSSSQLLILNPRVRNERTPEEPLLVPECPSLHFCSPQN
ncbi:hypothetical protein B0J17DRAFT_3599 [Rhizoctonia solani]|nr:hypothetical protein B0J17DRAFT_3599 [Rhizoctonia solani]